MIVRIATEAQYELSDGDLDELNKFDNAAATACHETDEQGFHASFEQLLDYVRTKGTLVGDDELVGSDIILPPPDISFEEAKSEFQGEGLIPG
jgi:hypothetical protein